MILSLPKEKPYNKEPITKNKKTKRSQLGAAQLILAIKAETESIPRHYSTPENAHHVLRRSSQSSYVKTDIVIPG